MLTPICPWGMGKTRLSLFCLAGMVHPAAMHKVGGRASEPGKQKKRGHGAKGLLAKRLSTRQSF